MGQVVMVWGIDFLGFEVYKSTPAVNIIPKILMSENYRENYIHFKIDHENLKSQVCWFERQIVHMDLFCFILDYI